MTGSWKTTVFGVISAAAAFVSFGQSTFHIAFPMWVQAIAAFTLMGGLAGLGIVGKDSDMTGGQRGQPSTPQALADANQAPAVGPTAPVPAPHAADAMAAKQAAIDAQHKLEGK